MRFLLMGAVVCLLIEASPVHAHSAEHIGYKAAKDMAQRLWSNKYEQDCFRSDRYFAELMRQQHDLSASAYHRGYRRGLEDAEAQVAQRCHATADRPQAPEGGECPQTGLQHGANLGSQVCKEIMTGFRTMNTCTEQARSYCFDGLKSFVSQNCRHKLASSDYRRAEQDCQMTFAQRS